MKIPLQASRVLDCNHGSFALSRRFDCSYSKMDQKLQSSCMPARPTYLQVGRAVVQELQHVADVVRVLDDEVELHVELAAHQLRDKQDELEWLWTQTLRGLRSRWNSPRRYSNGLPASVHECCLLDTYNAT